MEPKSMNVVSIEDAKGKVGDIEVTGDGDLWQLLSKASSKDQGWMKSSKAMTVGDGCVVQVTTQQCNPDGSYALAEAICFVPDVHVEDDVDGGRQLVAD